MTHNFMKNIIVILYKSFFIEFVNSEIDKKNSIYFSVNVVQMRTGLFM